MARLVPPQRKLWYLQQLNFFSGLSRADVEGLCGALNRRAHKRGDLLMGPESRANLIYLVRSGVVRVQQTGVDGSDVLLAILRAGHLFGTSTAIGTGERPAYASMLQDGIICETNARDFVRVLSNHPDCARRLLLVALNQFLSLEHQLSGLLAKDVPARLAQVLLQLARDHSGRLPARLTHAELARLIGTSRETVTRTLAPFVDQGLVASGYRTLDILDPNGLRREAGLVASELSQITIPGSAPAARHQPPGRPRPARSPTRR